jgi:hypothetical protein
MPGHECYHCKQWVEEGEAHDCWTTTEAALTRDLSEDLQDAYERLRETAAEFGEQRIYASHHSIMFSRKSCYFFVRPKRKWLEVVMFLGRRVHGPQVKRAEPSSKTKLYHVIHITHRDEVEAPITDWLREAYELEDVVAAKKPPAPKKARKALTKKAVAAKSRTVKKTRKSVAKKAGAKKTASATRKRATRR